MFEESLLESAHLVRVQNRWPAVASFALQTAVAAALVTVPLLQSSIIPLRAPMMALAAPAPPPPPKPPTPQRVHVEPAAQSSSTAPPIIEQVASEPSRLGHLIDTRHFSDEAPSATGPVSMVGSGTNPLAALSSGEGSSARRVVAAGPTRPVPVSRGVSAGLLLSPIQPTYPMIARAAHVEGTVIIHAIISKQGRIESAAAISGPGMLQGAALEAVRSARYRPYLLNGEPTEVDTTFNVVFHLGG